MKKLTVEIESLKQSLAATLENKTNVLDTQEKAKSKSYRLQREIETLEDSLPELATEALLAGTEPTRSIVAWQKRPCMTGKPGWSLRRLNREFSCTNRYGEHWPNRWPLA